MDRLYLVFKQMAELEIGSIISPWMAAGACISHLQPSPPNGIRHHSLALLCQHSILYQCSYHITLCAAPKLKLAYIFGTDSFIHSKETAQKYSPRMNAPSQLFVQYFHCHG